ncbi:hypothetical protein SALBM311S_08274 [Streptomyces alboniger]
MTVVYRSFEDAALYAATTSVAVPLTRLPLPATDPVPSPLSSLRDLAARLGPVVLRDTWALARELMLYCGA